MSVQACITISIPSSGSKGAMRNCRKGEAREHSFSAIISYFSTHAEIALSAKSVPFPRPAAKYTPTCSTPNCSDLWPLAVPSTNPHVRRSIPKKRRGRVARDRHSLQVLTVRNPRSRRDHGHGDRWAVANCTHLKSSQDNPKVRHHSQCSQVKHLPFEPVEVRCLFVASRVLISGWRLPCMTSDLPQGTATN